MALWSDFKKFAFKGNVLDLAVGVIIGASFQKIVTALVTDVIMPLVAGVTPASEGNWRTALKFALRGDVKEEKNPAVINLGEFLGSIVDFVIVAFVLFLIVSRILKAAEQRLGLVEDDKKPETKECPFCTELVAAKATRCKACTSELSAATALPKPAVP